MSKYCNFKVMTIIATTLGLLVFFSSYGKVLPKDIKNTTAVVDKKADENINIATASDRSLKNNVDEKVTSIKINAALYKYMSDINNRNSVMKTALNLHKGDPHNACVYFVSEALRRVGTDIPTKTCATGDLCKLLTKLGWQKDTNLCNLNPGDICFTTNGSNKEPTHTFIFIGWTDINDKKYADICDNQSYDYGTVLHTRNISMAIVHNGTPKEATAFFMR